MQKPATQGQKCPTCHGDGFVRVRQKTGTVVKNPCTVCAGTGRKGYWTK